MRVHTITWSICLVALLAATGSAGAEQEAERVSRRPLGESLPTYDAPAAPGPLEGPVGDLRLRDALALALLHNPRLATFSWDIRAAEAAQLQAGAWPNPEAGLEFEDFGGTGVLEGTTVAEATLALSQLVLLGGKRGKRTEVARLENRLANWDYEATRIQTYATTAGVFVQVLAAQEQLALTEKIVEVARDIQAAVSARVRAGGTLALEENRAGAAVETSLIERGLAERSLMVARRNLVAMWGSDTPGFERAVGDLEAVGDGLPALDSLMARVDHNPGVARWTAELEQRLAQVSLIKADRIPDLNIAAGIRHHNAVDDFAFVVGLSAPLPTWNRRQGAIREAQYLADQAGPARHAAATNIRRDIAVAYEVLAGAHMEVTRLRDRVLPEAEAAAAKSGDAYSAGAIQLTDVLDIQRTFFRLRVRQVNALARYHGAVAELEGLVGEPLSDVPLFGEAADGRGGE